MQRAKIFFRREGMLPGLAPMRPHNCLISLGASRVDWAYPDGARFVVLADPEGNRFCVVNVG